VLLAWLFYGERLYFTGIAGKFEYFTERIFSH
jgi:hypothetical protein